MKRGRSGGFTLIEMLAVVIIVAVMMLVAVGRMDFLLPEYRLRSAARELGALMKQGRARAAATGKDVYLVIDLSRDSYHLLVAIQQEAEEDLEEGEEPVFLYEPAFPTTLPEGVDLVDVIFGGRNKVAEGTARVRFSALGASSHTIVNFKEQGGDELAVKLNGFTGHLSFYGEYTDADELLEDEEP
jgi:prepilin-type N-terminal cleavage/methylation domain-containing protein